MQLRFILLIGFLLLSSTALAASNTIKVGVLYNLTGGMAAIDQPGLHGMELAKDIINKEGGVLGKN